MRAIPEHFNVVIPGSWNVGLFHPSWIKEHLLDGTDPQIELTFSEMGPSTRIRHDPVIFLPEETRFKIYLLNDAVENWKIPLEYASKIAAILNHTPINGLGVNFGFEVNEPTETLTSAFNSSDNNSLIASGAEIQSTNIGRSLKFQDDSILNFYAATNSSTGSCMLTFNYHFATKNANEIQDLVSAAIQKDLLAHAFGLLKNIYDLEIQNTEEGDEDE